jgi:hypothetical protein
VPGADNQQERPSIEAIPVSLGSYIAGFALGEASFMIVCRKRGDYRRSWKLSAAFNVSQYDRAPLDLFRATPGAARSAAPGMAAGTGRSIAFRTCPRQSFPASSGFRSSERRPKTSRVGWTQSASSRAELSRESDYHQVLALREGMNRGGKRRYRMDGILRGHTPSSTAERPAR